MHLTGHFLRLKKIFKFLEIICSLEWKTWRHTDIYKMIEGFEAVMITIKPATDFRDA